MSVGRASSRVNTMDQGQLVHQQQQQQLHKKNALPSSNSTARTRVEHFQNEMLSLMESHDQLEQENRDLHLRLKQKNEVLLQRMTSSLPKEITTNLLLRGISTQNLHIDAVGDIALSTNMHEQFEATCSKQSQNEMRNMKSLIKIQFEKLKANQVLIAELMNRIKASDHTLHSTQEMLKDKCETIASLEQVICQLTAATTTTTTSNHKDTLLSSLSLSANKKYSSPISLNRNDSQRDISNTSAIQTWQNKMKIIQNHAASTVVVPTSSSTSKERQQQQQQQLTKQQVPSSSNAQISKDRGSTSQYSNIMNTSASKDRRPSASSLNKECSKSQIIQPVTFFLAQSAARNPHRILADSNNNNNNMNDSRLPKKKNSEFAKENTTSQQETRILSQPTTYKELGIKNKNTHSNNNNNNNSNSCASLPFSKSRTPPPQGIVSTNNIQNENIDTMATLSSSNNTREAAATTIGVNPEIIPTKTHNSTNNQHNQNHNLMRNRDVNVQQNSASKILLSQRSNTQQSDQQNNYDCSPQMLSKVKRSQLRSGGDNDHLHQETISPECSSSAKRSMHNYQQYLPPPPNSARGNYLLTTTQSSQHLLQTQEYLRTASSDDLKNSMFLQQTSRSITAEDSTLQIPTESTSSTQRGSTRRRSRAERLQKNSSATKLHLNQTNNDYNTFNPLN